MASIVYQITSGTPDFTVRLSPVVAPNQVHSSLGIYSFNNIPDGTYILTLTDSTGCTVSKTINTIGLTTTTTTKYTGCYLSGIVKLTDCSFYGVALITVPPGCERTPGLTTYALISQYETISTSTVVITSGSSISACAGAAYMNSFGAEYIDTLFSGIDIQAIDLVEGATCYLANGTTDCTLAPDGWYFTETTAINKTVFHIESGIIAEVLYCAGTTTTTTSTSTSTTTTSTTVCPIDVEILVSFPTTTTTTTV